MKANLIEELSRKRGISHLKTEELAQIQRVKKALKSPAKYGSQISLENYADYDTTPANNPTLRPKSLARIGGAVRFKA